MCIEEIEEIKTALDIIRRAARNEAEQGGMFEEYIVGYLGEGLYAEKFTRVCRWANWRYRWGPDEGIDIVARERETGLYWAIQCKFYDEHNSISGEDIESFLNASRGRFEINERERGFNYCCVVSTTDRYGPGVERAIERHHIPVYWVGVPELARGPKRWPKFRDRFP